MATLTGLDRLRVLGWCAGEEAQRLVEGGAGLVETCLSLPASPSAVLPADCAAAIGAGPFIAARAMREAEMQIWPASQGLHIESHAPGAVHIVSGAGTLVLFDSRMCVMSPDADAFQLFIAPLITAGCTVDGVEADLALRGFCFMRGAFQEQKIAALTRALDNALEADIERYGHNRLAQGGQLGAVRNLPARDAAFTSLLETGPIVELADRVMSAGSVLHTYDGLVLGPGEERFPWDFHTDVDTLGGASFPRSVTPGLNFLVFLDHANEYNGATWIAPGSHYCSRKPDALSALGELSEQACGAPGDVLAFDARLWHCAGNNASAAPRRLLKLLFTPNWLQPMLDFRRSQSSLSWGRLTEGVRRRLGEHAAPPAGLDALLERLSPDAFSGKRE